MKLTLEQPSYARKVTIEVGADDLMIGEVWEDLIKPALLALSFDPKNVAELAGEDEDGFFIPCRACVSRRTKWEADETMGLSSPEPVPDWYDRKEPDA